MQDDRDESPCGFGIPRDAVPPTPNSGTNPVSSLRDHLLDSYGGYADRRIKNRSLDRPIQIDDKGPHDVYPHFCTISARVPDRIGETLILTLQNCPCNSELMALVEKRGGTVTPSEHGPTIRLSIAVNHVGTVASLSHAISKMTKRRRRYSDPNWKWICPRTANSLDRLAGVLPVYKADQRPDDSEILGGRPRIISRTRSIIENSSS